MTLIVTPLRHVPDLLARRKPSHVLTLTAPNTEPPDCSPAFRLALRFNDITAPRPGYIVPDAQIIHFILGFAETWPREQPMLIHCFAGISRSTAAAYIIACRHFGPGCEQDLAQRLRVLSPSATPNSLMIALADDILEREGRMIAAIAAIGRGAEASEGEAFELDLNP